MTGMKDNVSPVLAATFVDFEHPHERQAENLSKNTPRSHRISAPVGEMVDAADGDLSSGVPYEESDIHETYLK